MSLTCHYRSNGQISSSVKTPDTPLPYTTKTNPSQHSIVYIARIPSRWRTFFLATYNLLQPKTPMHLHLNHLPNYAIYYTHKIKFYMTQSRLFNTASNVTL